MSDHLKLALAAVVVAFLGAWGIHGAGFAGSSAVRAQEKLQARANERLLVVGAEDWARVSMRGQRAELAGIAPTELDLAAARGAVRSATWTGGLLMGGVTVLSSRDADVWTPREGAYGWRAELDDNRLRLAGATPTRELGGELESLAGVLFADHRVINDQVVDPLPPGEGWGEAARAALAVLSHLTSGAAVLSNFELEVTGEAANENAAEAARRSLARLGGVVAATSRAEVRAPTAQSPAPVTVPARPPAPPPEPAPARETADASRATPDDPSPSPRREDTPNVAPQEPAPRAEDGPAADCQARLDETLSATNVLFAVNSADISEDGRSLLQAVASIVSECAPMTLRVEGHTDDTGVPALNQSLSERRARAVVEQLIELGVAPARMTSVGFGATRPVAENDSPEGRRANRRIEIIVIP